ncbi:hypothetical protein D5086_008560 [Populus alba]|uniref:Uncharacterized protein n=1 Tax=Populus alba TaxID=43335 RepID=A0ACC4CG91_POPAL
MGSDEPGDKASGSTLSSSQLRFNQELISVLGFKKSDSKAISWVLSILDIARLQIQDCPLVSSLLINLTPLISACSLELWATLHTLLRSCLGSSSPSITHSLQALLLLALRCILLLSEKAKKLSASTSQKTKTMKMMNQATMDQESKKKMSCRRLGGPKLMELCTISVKLKSNQANHPSLLAVNLEQAL